MCSHSASVETGLIYSSYIYILILNLTQGVKITHKKLCLYKLKQKQQIQLFCCSVSVVYSFYFSYKFRQDNQFVQQTRTHTKHTLSLDVSMSLTELI